MRRTLAVLLFLLAFSATAQEERDEVPVPLFLDGEYQGDVVALIDMSGGVQVAPQQVLTLLIATVSESVRASAADLFQDNDPVDLRAFSALGITVTFDPDTLALVADVPPLARRTRPLSLRGTSVQPRGTPVPPSQFSVVANLDLWSRFTYESQLYEGSVTPELALRISDVVLESQGGVRTGTQPFFLDHLRLIWDVPGIDYRVEAGDLTWSRTQLANTSRLTGLSLSRQATRGGTAQRAGRVIDRFFLNEDATVEVYVNETRRQQRALTAGNYELVDVPLGDGLNRITVTVAGADRRLVELVLPYDSELRAPGELDAGVAFAVADRDVLRPLLLAYQSYGVTPEFTVGARQGFEPLDTQVDLGLEAVLATAAGTFLLEPDVGIGPQERLAIDVPLRYSYLDTTPGSYLSFGLSATYHSLSGDDGLTVAQALSASGYISFAFADGFSVVPSASYEYGLHDGTQNFDLSASLRRSIRGGSAVSGDVGFSWDGEPRFYATVTFSASFPEAQQNLFLQQNLESQEFSAFWARYAGEEDPALNYSASTKIPADLSRNATLTGQVGYANRLLETSLSHNVSGVVERSEFRNATSASVQTALVFADGSFAVTRPVGGSFALVVPGGLLSGQDVTVRQGGREISAVGGALVVLPGVSNYAPTQVTVESSEVLVGVDEDALRYVLEPAYRSGALIEASPRPSVVVSGRLVDEDGDPVVLEIGELQNEAGEKTAFFTDEAGVFELYGLSPGLYEVRVASRDALGYTFTVAPDASAYVDLGDLEPQSLESTGGEQAE